MARVLYRFDFELVPGQEGWMDKQRIFVVWEKPDLQVRIKERT